MAPATTAVSAAPEPDLLKSASVYLDSSASVTNDADGPRPPSLDAGARPPRPSRAERLAAEQAVWVRDKFQLAASEQLIASFSAALLRSILIQGRMHITTSHLCFYAKIFGRVTREVLPFASVARVKKRRGGLVANAIKVYLADPDAPPLVIASLNHRARAFAIIQARLRQLNPRALDPAEAPGRALSAYPADDDDTSDDRSLDEAEAAPRGGSGGSGGGSGGGSSSQASASASDDYDGIAVPPEAAAEAKAEAKADVGAGMTEDEVGVWRSADDAVDSLKGSAFEKRAERARVVLNAPVRTVFNVLFISSWLKEYHASTTNRDLEFSSWYRATDGLMTRDVTFRRQLGYKLGPKETRVNEVQRYSFTSGGGVVLELEGRNLDVPYGDYFVVESFFEMSPVDDAQRTLLTLSMAVHFNRSTILKGKIESGAMSETKKAFEKVAALAALRIDEYMATRLARQAPLSSSSSARPLAGGAPAKGGALPAAAEPVAAVTAAAREAAVVAAPAAAPAPTPTPASAPAPARAVVSVCDDGATRLLRGGTVLGVAVSCALLLGVAVLLLRLHARVAGVERLLVAAAERAACAAPPAPAVGRVAP